jgi:hypothetical protein
MPAGKIAFWGLRTTFVGGFLMFCLTLDCDAHDWTRPDLDNWYSSLRSSGGTLAHGASCCSRNDCHTTDAELRNGQWWARLGVRHPMPNGAPDWELGEWRKIHDEIIVRQENGLPVRNEAGEAVICHPQKYRDGGFVADQVPIYCFVPPFQT